MAKTKVIEVHFQPRRRARAEEKKFRRQVKVREKAGDSRGDAQAWVENRFYGLPRGAGGPRHPGGRTPFALRKEILTLMRSRRAEGKTSGQIMKELEERRDEELQSRSRCPDLRVTPPQRTLYRRYRPIVFPEKKRASGTRLQRKT